MNGLFHSIFSNSSQVVIDIFISNLYYSQNALRVGTTTLIFYMLQLVISGYPVNSANRARLRYRHVSFRPSAAQCRNLIFLVTCLSLGDSGLPLRGNRNDGSDVGTCRALADWLKKATKLSKWIARIFSLRSLRLCENNAGYLPAICLVIPFSQLWPAAGLYHEA